jgi:hypothetical protein
VSFFSVWTWCGRHLTRQPSSAATTKPRSSFRMCVTTAQVNAVTAPRLHPPPTPGFLLTCPGGHPRRMISSSVHRRHPRVGDLRRPGACCYVSGNASRDSLPTVRAAHRPHGGCQHRMRCSHLCSHASSSPHHPWPRTPRVAANATQGARIEMVMAMVHARAVPYFHAAGCAPERERVQRACAPHPPPTQINIPWLSVSAAANPANAAGSMPVVSHAAVRYRGARVTLHTHTIISRTHTHTHGVSGLPHHAQAHSR